MLIPGNKGLWTSAEDGGEVLAPQSQLAELSQSILEGRSLPSSDIALPKLASLTVETECMLQIQCNLCEFCSESCPHIDVVRNKADC